MSNCQWCGSGIYELDKVCSRCGAPHIKAKEQKEETFGSWINKIEIEEPTSYYLSFKPEETEKTYLDNLKRLISDKDFKTYMGAR